MNKRKIMPFIFSMFLLTGFILHGKELRAQEFAFKGEVFGLIGAAWPNDEKDPFGKGFLYGGGGGYMISDGWEIVGEVQGQRNSLDYGPGAFFHESQSLTVGGGFQYHFSKSRLQPYWRIGLSHTRLDGAKGFRADENHPETRTEGKQSFWRPDVGFGCKIFVSENVSIKPEARVYIGGFPKFDPAWDIANPNLVRTAFSIGLGYHW